MAKHTIFNDPIHGTIELEDSLVKIINDPRFQRLRKIKQLSVSQYVYPGAVHTRFEHSIGVCYIAGEFLKELKKNADPQIKSIINENRLNVLVAALCHDLGHGCFSHTYDSFVYDEKIVEPEIKHEYRSTKMAKIILTGQAFDTEMIEQLIVFSEIGKGVSNQFGKQFCESEVSNEFIENEMIKAMKDKHRDHCKLEKKNMFLFEIVANGFSGIDVDKMDYFARDSHYTGLSQQFDWRRYIKTTCVKKTTSGSYRLCTQDKAIHMLDELFHLRYMLYITAYHHKIVLIIEKKLKDIFRKGDKVIEFKGDDDNWYKMSECWRNMGAFQRLDDNVLELLKLAADNGPNGGTAIQLDGIKVYPDNVTEELKKCLKKFNERKFPKFVCKSEMQQNLQIPNTETVKRKFDYGMKENDPMCFHHFYNKLEDDKPCTLTKCNFDQLGLLRPHKFSATITFVYFDVHEHEGSEESAIAEMKKIKKSCCNETDAS